MVDCPFGLPFCGVQQTKAGMKEENEEVARSLSFSTPVLDPQHEGKANHYLDRPEYSTVSLALCPCKLCG